MMRKWSWLLLGLAACSSTPGFELTSEDAERPEVDGAEEGTSKPGTILGGESDSGTETPWDAEASETIPWDALGASETGDLPVCPDSLWPKLCGTPKACGRYDSTLYGCGNGKGYPTTIVCPACKPGDGPCSDHVCQTSCKRQEDFDTWCYSANKSMPVAYDCGSLILTDGCKKTGSITCCH